MKPQTMALYLLGVLLVTLLVFALTACNSSGLSTKPRATFARVACLDVNRDGRVNETDASAAQDVPDFNADDVSDDADAEFLRGVDIALDPAAVAGACDEGRKQEPEYLVAYDYFSDANVTCEPGEQGVLVLGVGGGVDNLKDDDEAAGVRSIVDALLKKYEGRDVQTIGVIAGSGVLGAMNGNAAMEDWLTNAVAVYLDRFPCLRLVTVGFSHGAVTVAVVATRLEATHSDRIIATVSLDRIEDFYLGDLQAMPRASGLVNVYQTNTGGLGGRMIEAPNVLNFDASGEEAPEDGHNGGSLAPVVHVTIDNSKGVRNWVVDVVLARS
jgi:hypothetical protein